MTKVSPGVYVQIKSDTGVGIGDSQSGDQSQKLRIMIFMKKSQIP